MRLFSGSLRSLDERLRGSERAGGGKKREQGRSMGQRNRAGEERGREKKSGDEGECIASLWNSWRARAVAGEAVDQGRLYHH